MTARRSLSPMQRLAVFERHNGICHLCEQKIKAGEAWDVSHDRALALLGEDDDVNRKPAHRACHKVRTKDDVKAIAKAKRVKARHIGIKPRSSFPRKPEGYEYDWSRGTPRLVKI
jgi:5-methylcytosine-specific restriction protein A